jgi:hypothetical protein
VNILPEQSRLLYDKDNLETCLENFSYGILMIYGEDNVNIPLLEI